LIAIPISMKAKQNSAIHFPVPEPWVPTGAACQHLGISIPTIRRWIKDGRLNPKRTPTGEFRFRLSELDSILD
jgi:excisionase family DNA binding protein